MATITEILKTDIAHKSDYVRSATGDLDRISGLENFKLALFHRLITSPGSFAFRPNYGVGIKDYQNSLSSFSVQRRLALLIKDQYELDPRTEEVTGIRFDVSDTEPDKTQIIVKVKPVGYDEIETAFIPFGEGVI